MPNYTQIKETVTKWHDISQEKYMEYQRRRGSYKIKNVYLTLNKIHTCQLPKNKIANQKKYDNKEKSKAYSIFKPNKYALRSTKFINSELIAGNRPLLQIRHLDCRNF